LTNSELSVAQNSNGLGAVLRDNSDSKVASDLFETSLYFGATLQAPKSNASNDILEVTKGTGAKQDSSVAVYIVLGGVLAMLAVSVVIRYIKSKRF
jgi:hypothetical protein